MGVYHIHFVAVTKPEQFKNAATVIKLPHPDRNQWHA
jgi:hypothetical protein